MSFLWPSAGVAGTDVPEERVASIFRVLKNPRAMKGFYSRADFPTLKMEAIRSSETSVPTRPTRRHIQEDAILEAQLYVTRSEADLYFESGRRDARTGKCEPQLQCGVVFLSEQADRNVCNNILSIPCFPYF
jgi:hypothetical protein